MSINEPFATESISAGLDELDGIFKKYCGKEVKEKADFLFFVTDDVITTLHGSFFENFSIKKFFKEF